MRMPVTIFIDNPFLSADHAVSSESASGSEFRLAQCYLLVDTAVVFQIFAQYSLMARCQDRLSDAFRNGKKWTEMSILNVARMGKFSSDVSLEFVRSEWCRNYCSRVLLLVP
ncbi:MAG: glycogen/starch/alpha-glucan phosphorylase [Desulfobulbaceae bacterium]